MTTKDWKTLACILGIHFLMWMALGPSTPSTDDLCYLQDAMKVSDGSYTFNASPKTQRLGMILPTYGLTSIFGMHPFVITLYPLFCSLLSIVMVFGWLRHLPTMAVVASLLLALNITQITYSCALFPDVILSMMMFGLVLAFQLRHDQRPWLALLGGSMLVAGFFVKQLIVVIIPWLAYWLIKDLLNGHNRRFHLVFASTIIIAGGSVWTAVYLHTGDWLFLIASVEEQHNRVFADLDATALLERLTWQPLFFLNKLTGFWPLLLLALPTLMQKITNISVNLARQYFLYLFIFFWVGSTSLQSYAPLLLLDRMWLPMLIPLCILAANTLTVNLKFGSKKSMALLFTAFALSSFIALNSSSEGEAMFYLLVPICLYLGHKMDQRERGDGLVAVTITLPFLLLAVWFVVSNSVYLH